MAEHLTIEQLLLASDGEAGSDADSHLAACSECRQQLDEIRKGLDDYNEYHRTALRKTQPPPPHAWRSLTGRPSHARYVWAGAVAAAITVAVFLWPARLTQGLEASDVLTRAEASERAPSTTRRVVLRGSFGQLVRPAVWVHEKGGHPLQARFQRAGYSWDEPMTVRAFAAWRRRLARHHDSVKQTRHPKTAEAIFVLTTETDSSSLRQASLSLREQDLQPVSASLRFDDNEVIEMEDDPAPSDGPSAPSTKGPAPTESRIPATSANPLMQELQVLAALHGIGADLGEPVQIEHENGSIVLSGRGISNTRKDQIEKAVAALDFVILRFDSTKAGATATPRRTATPAAQIDVGPIRAIVEQHLQGSMSFDQFVNDALDSSDALLSRAHALGALAARFAKVENELPPPGHEMLDAMRRDHTRAATQELQKLTALMASGFGIVNPSGPLAWNSVPAFRDATQEFDRVLTGMLTGARKADVEALRQAFLRLGESAR